MLATLTALLMSASPAHVVQQLAPQTVLAAKKKKKAKAKPKKDDSHPTQETTEGLDLTAPAASPAPGSETPASEGGTAESGAASETATPEASDEAFSVVGPHTLGEADNLIEGGIGWPGVYASYWRGVLANLDVGGRVGLNWGFEGMIARPVLGLRFQVQARYLVWDNGKLSLGVSFSPGALIYFVPAAGARGGLTLPVGATLGLPNFVEKLNLSVSLEVPFWVLFGVGAVVPFVAGVNGEYLLTDNLAVFLRLRPLGLSLWTNGGGVFYTFEGTAGVGLHL